MTESTKEWEFTRQPVGYRFEDSLLNTFDGIAVKSANLSFKKPIQGSNGRKNLMLLIERRDDEGRNRLDYFFLEEGDRLVQLDDGGLALVKDFAFLA